MASYPPPQYPPPAGAPFGQDPRQARRFQKQQQLMQKRAMQAQAAFYRQQTRALRRRSILGPLLVVAIGVVLLLVRAGRIPMWSFTRWYGHWWPLLLVGAGLVLVLEWAIDQIPREGSVPYGRRGVGAGVIFLLLVLAAGGAAVNSLHDGIFGFHANPDDLQQMLGEKHEYQEENDVPLAAGATLLIDNPHGDVTVVGRSGEARLHVAVNKEVFSWSDKDADRKGTRLSPMIKESEAGKKLTLTMPFVEGTSSDLSVTVPDTTQVIVTANHGAVRLSDLHAPVNVTANHGEVEVSAIDGSVNAHVNNREEDFSARDIHGDLSVKGEMEDLDITNVTGQVSLQGEFFGETHLQHLGGPMNFATSRTQFSLARLDGEVTMTAQTELTANDITGPTILRTRNRNIAFNRIAGDVTLSNSNGTVDVTGGQPLGNISIDNRNGSVQLTVPENAGFTLAAETQDGEVNDEQSLLGSNDGERSSLHGTVGDGRVHVNLHTSHADIDIHRAISAEPASQAPPEPPTPPKPPAPHSKAQKIKAPEPPPVPTT